MAFGNLLDVSRSSHAESTSGKVAAALNLVSQIETNGDMKVNLSLDGKNYIRWNTTTLQIEFYINNVKQGHLDATAFVAD